jgi:hypothetical protein
MDVEFADRRLFLSDGKNFYQILSFTQNRNDASIYISSPDFSKIKWLCVSAENGYPELTVTDSPGDGKLSVHGSGMTKITPNFQKLVVHGNYLLDSNKQALGVRYLFTIQLTKPLFLPPSPAFNRVSDFVITSNNLAPMVIIFFAIPRIGDLEVNFQVSFNMDDLESIPPDSGGGSFELISHCVFWFAYRTKHMDDWPPNPYICYYDGHIVPVFLVVGERQFKAEFRVPTYQMSNTKLSISM